MEDTPICHLLAGTPTEADLLPLNVNFDVLKTYVDESHLWRYLLKCKKCGRLLFYEFKEEIDWENGDDPQYTTFIPVKSEDEGEILQRKSSLELLGITPRIQQDSGKGNTDEVRVIR